MLNTVQSNILSDGSRLHLNHGPIDLIIEAFGETEIVQCAYERATNKFNNVLTDLVRELPALRSPISQNRNTLKSPVGLRMQNAVQPFYPTFVTPMAAVAGSVADYVLKILCEGDKLRKAYVNNGGDIAIHLDQHEVFNIGIITNLKTETVSRHPNSSWTSIAAFFTNQYKLNQRLIINLGLLTFCAVWPTKIRQIHIL